jgi:hypothetical protein
VPAEAEAGDVIAMFFGIGVPFVLRPIGRSDYRLIGTMAALGLGRSWD